MLNALASIYLNYSLKEPPRMEAFSIIAYTISNFCYSDCALMVPLASLPEVST